MADDKRAATDILLDIEARQISMEKRFQNVEYLLKSLLARANSVPPPAPAQRQAMPGDIINKDNFENRPRTNKFADLAAKAGVTVHADPVGEPVFSAKATTTEMEESLVRTSAPRGQRGPKPRGTKSSVSQVISCGEIPLFLANIEVLDANDDLISQTRTNPKGRWMMALAPGDYQVHVTKRFPPESGKKPVDTSYMISVPPSDKPLELDPFDMG